MTKSHPLSFTSYPANDKHLLSRLPPKPHHLFPTAYLLGLNPLALFGNGSGAMVSALTNGAHMLYFCTINHGFFSFLFKRRFPPLDLRIWKPDNFRIYYTIRCVNCQLESLVNRYKSIVLCFCFSGTSLSMDKAGHQYRKQQAEQEYKQIARQRSFHVRKVDRKTDDDQLMQ